MQPKYLIGLGIVAALVLFAGTIAVVARSGSDVTQPIPAAISTTSTVSPATTTTAATTSTTSTTTTTTTSTSTTTIAPLPANSNGGDDQAVDAGAEVTLTAIELSEPGQSLVWWQLAGPDVTAGEGRLRGNDAMFVAPDRPTTLRFRLDVTGRAGDVASDEVRVHVFEEADRAVFVDASDGDDANDGSAERPLRTLSKAAALTTGAPTDIYLRSVEAGYEIDRVALDAGTSLYGGYLDGWIRDVSRRADVRGTLLVSDSERTTISAVSIRGADAATGETSYGMVATGVGELLVEAATIRAGDADSGPSVGLATQSVGRIVIVDVDIASGRAGAGADGVDGADAGAPAPEGESAPASPPEAGAGGGNGGAGGPGGVGLAPGEPGEPGASDNAGDGGEPGEDGRPGRGGVGGAGGDGGRGGSGVAAGPRGSGGADGTAGAQGDGGGGGGGGGGLLVHDGGGGGGGGGGGDGGGSGAGGAGGHGSVGAWLVGADSVLIRDTTIQGGTAGAGGRGGSGGVGAAGGRGGDGAVGVSTFLETAGTGAGGGGGGAGGGGGQGGGGAGGRSVGLLSDQVGAIDVSGSIIRGGAGGVGGVGGEPGATGGSGLDGTGRTGGEGATGRDDAAAGGVGSSGGDSVGWWDAGDADLTIADTTVEGGAPGAPGGSDGVAGRSIDTIF